MHAAVLSGASSTWGIAQPLSSAPHVQAVSQSISCGGVAYCSIGGGLSADSQHYQAIVADETPVLSTTTIESLSARRVIYGHEQAEKVSVTVSARLGIVTGKVAVMSDRKTACTITLAGGKGSCTIPAANFSTGPHALTAMYGGATGFAASSSAAKHVSVVKAASRTALTLSVAKVRYGHERAEKLTVKVIPQYMGTPGGTVAITVSRIRVCVITLKRATGSCRLRARTLRVGIYQVLATYSSNPDFKASVSPKKALTVRRR